MIPVGGGGLCAGVALAIKAAKPDVQIVGVQAAACAPFPASMAAGEPIEAMTALTIADGIAVKRPGGITLPLLTELTDEVVVVGEDETAEAMALLLERCKLVVEGAGAVGVAALLGGQVKPAEHGVTVAILSGGNVDAGLLAAIARRHENESGRRLVLLTRVPDRPGALARILADGRRHRARTSSTSATCAKGWTCTCARPRSRWCWRRAGTSTRSACSTLNDEGYVAQVLSADVHPPAGEECQGHRRYLHSQVPAGHTRAASDTEVAVSVRSLFSSFLLALVLATRRHRRSGRGQDQGHPQDQGKKRKKVKLATVAAPAVCANTDLVPDAGNLELIRAALACLHDQIRSQNGLGTLADNARAGRRRRRPHRRHDRPRLLRARDARGRHVRPAHPRRRLRPPGRGLVAGREPDLGRAAISPRPRR